MCNAVNRNGRRSSTVFRVASVMDGLLLVKVVGNLVLSCVLLTTEYLCIAVPFKVVPMVSSVRVLLLIVLQMCSTRLLELLLVSPI